MDEMQVTGTEEYKASGKDRELSNYRVILLHLFVNNIQVIKRTFRNMKHVKRLILKLEGIQPIKNSGNRQLQGAMPFIKQTNEAPSFQFYF